MENHGLTTSQAPFIEKAIQNGEHFIEQPYELYSEENQLAWRMLFAHMLPKWEKFANRKFLEGISFLKLNPSRIPRLEEINHFLEPLTRFQAKAVSGYVPSALFFECLSRREFPTTITIRDCKKLEYLPEPDIFHDVAGHVPMHTDPLFADLLEKFGALARFAREKTDIDCTRSNMCALSRFFWFTVEFGLLREKGRICAYGSGLLSSAREIEHSVLADAVQRVPFQLDRVIHQSFEIDHMQPLLFVIDSFDQLFDEVTRLEQWLIQGKLDNIAGCL